MMMASESPAKVGEDQHPPSTRKKVKHACYQCKMAHAACDIQRPCKRCESMGMAGDCRDPDPKKRARNVTPLLQRRIQSSWPEDQRPIRQDEKRLRFSDPPNFEGLGAEDLGLIERRVNDWATENGIFGLGTMTGIKAEQNEPDLMITTPSITTTPALNSTGSTNLFYPAQPTTTTTTTTTFSSKPQPIPKKPLTKSRSASTSPNTLSFMNMYQPGSQPTPQPLTPFGTTLSPNATTNNTTTTTPGTFKQQQKPVSPRPPQSRAYTFDQFISPSVGGNAFKPPPPVPTPLQGGGGAAGINAQDYGAADVDQTTTSILQTILSELKEVKMSHHELMKEQQALRGEILHLQSPPTSPDQPPQPLFPSAFGAATGATQPSTGFSAFGSQDVNGSSQSPIFISDSANFSSLAYTSPVSPVGAANFSSPTTTTQGTFLNSYGQPQQQPTDTEKPSNIALFSVPGMRGVNSPPSDSSPGTATNNSGTTRFPFKSNGGTPYWRATNFGTPMKAPRRASVPGKASSLPMMPNTTGRFDSTYDGNFGDNGIPSPLPTATLSPFQEAPSPPLQTAPVEPKISTSTSRIPFAVEDPTKPFAILAKNGADVVFTMVNDPFCKLYGYQRNELIGKSWKLVLPNTQQDVCEGFFRRLLSKRSPGPASEIISISIPNRTRDGTLFDTRSRHQIFYDDTGHLSWNIVYIESHSLETSPTPTPPTAPSPTPTPTYPIPSPSFGTSSFAAPYPSPLVSSSFPPSPGLSLFTPDSIPFSPYSQPATPFMNTAGTAETPMPGFVTPLGYEIDGGREDAAQGNENNTDISSYLNQNSPFISFGGGTVPYEGPKPRPSFSQPPGTEAPSNKQKEEESSSFSCLQELLQFEPLKKEEPPTTTHSQPQPQTQTEDLNRKEGDDYTPNDEEVEKEFEDIMMDSTDGTFNSFFPDEEKP